MEYNRFYEYITSTACYGESSRYNYFYISEIQDELLKSGWMNTRNFTMLQGHWQEQLTMESKSSPLSK